MKENPDQRRYAPAVARNREPILDVLRQILPLSGLVLEIASGTGEHAAFFARHLAHLTWQPSDRQQADRASIAAHVEAAALPNLHPPRQLDVRVLPWPITACDAILCINMIHISPWESSLALMAGAARLLPAGGPLYLYGAYRREGRHTAPSNEEFDAWLKAQDPAWGVRDLEAVVGLAAKHGLALDRVVDMPAHNLSVVFRRERA
ncbi:MAG TPA: DUF938 domain-containing protein [Stellaceae bacterium]|nr:DUF938 domain-containing protein [Stellaceae bacterium]